ncbi:MAG: hypothetical protein ACPGUV_03480, partial [Polyangiales bacterium]
MAHDTTLPRSNLIWFYAVLSVVVLFVLKFVFDSYFIAQIEAEQFSKQARSGERANARRKSRELRQLDQGAMPVSTAMQQLARRGRMAAPAIAPIDSADLGALTGWATQRRKSDNQRLSRRFVVEVAEDETAA